MDEEISKHVLKTGTLTIGIVCKDGIVIAADRRQSYASGNGVAYLAGKAKKIVEVTNRMVATTAGTASDTRRILDIITAEFRLKELRTKEKVTVPEAASYLANLVYGNIRTPSMIPSIAHFLLGGYDDNGIYLFDIAPDGYIQQADTYTASGGGIMQAHPILDSEYKKGMSLEEGAALATKCIRASMGRDPSVGAGIDIYTIKKGDLKQVVDKEAITTFEITK